MIGIREHKGDRLEYLQLLLLADEEPLMVSNYIDRGWMFVLEIDEAVKGECIVTDEGDGILEIKSIAVSQDAQRQGYGKSLVEYVLMRFKGLYTRLRVGTGDSPRTIPFYESCGFRRASVIRNFFTENYSHQITEDGVVLKDMIILERSF